jgi:hypothetical protein
MNAIYREEKAARREMISLRLSRKTMKNATACRHFLHANDQDADGQPSCYFSKDHEDSSWGFWVSRDGKVTVDSESSNGSLPSQRTVDACKRAAVAYLSK